MKKFLMMLALCVVGAAVMVGCGAKDVEDEKINDTSAPQTEQNERPTGGVGGGTAQIANPFHTFDTLEEAIESAGVSMKVPEEVDGNPVSAYRSMPGKMLEIIYSSNGGDEYIRIRKAPGEDDISGNYSAEVYDEETLEMGEIKVETESKDGVLYNAIWTHRGCSYAISSTIGIDRTEFEKLVSVMTEPYIFN